MIVELPWPSRVLSPNGRAHWRELAKAKKQYRLIAFVMARKCGVLGGMVKGDQRLRLTLTFHPAVKRDRDIDNLLASMKAGLDGLADALMVDDCQFDPEVVIGECVKGGVVRVKLHV